MGKKEFARKIITVLAFAVGVAIAIICIGKILNVNTESTDNLITIEELEEQIEILEEELQYKENRLEELKEKNEEAEELIELLRTQLEELNVEPYEL